MNVIIVVASKHGSTRAIATTVGDELRIRGNDVSMADADEPNLSLDGYDAAIVGSAIYLGHWMKDARAFLALHHDQLRTMPLWLFSSGPLGDDSSTRDPLPDVGVMADTLGYLDHAVFAGNLEKADLNLAERATVHLVHAPYGDARDWDAIRHWARTIADDLATIADPPPVATEPSGRP